MANELSQMIESANAQNVLFKKRQIVLSDAIHSGVAKRVIADLLSLEADNATADIWIFLNSPGGEVNSGFGIYDTMRFIQPKVKVIVTGLAASIATVILLGADKEHRFAMPNSQLLIHQPLIQGSMRGQASDIEITANEILKTRQKLVELYHKETKQPKDRIEKDVERDYWMSADEAKSYGLVHAVVGSWNEIR